MLFRINQLVYLTGERCTHYNIGDEDTSDSVMPTYGQISEFEESKESWTEYAERLQQYFLANEITNAEKQRAIFLSVCGGRTYSLLRDILQPQKPAEASLTEILEQLGKHHNPKPSLIVERFKFHSRSRAEKESVQEFVAGLRKLTEHCAFNETLEDMIRDRLVCGINDDQIQRRLLAEPKLTLKRAVEIAIAMELAVKNVVDLQNTKQSVDAHQVHRVNKSKPTKSQHDCYRCGGKHDSKTCRFREAKCFNCQKKGHLAKVCRGEKKKQAGENGEKGGKCGKADKEEKTHKVTEGQEYPMYQIQDENPARGYEISVDLCGETKKMEIDTGATKTILNEATYNQLRAKMAALRKTTTTLTTYTGESIPILGTAVDIPVKYGDQEHLLSALVVKSSGPNLFGRDWLKVIKIDWER